MAKRRADFARFNAALPAIKANLRTMRYADERDAAFGDPTPLLALLDEIERAYTAKRIEAPTASPIQQQAPALRSLQRLREILSSIDPDAPHDDMTELCLHLVADACVLFSPFLDGQPLQQAFADVLAGPSYRTGRTKGGATRSEVADDEREAVLQWAKRTLAPGDRRSARAKATRLAPLVPLQADGTYPEPFTAFGTRLKGAHKVPSLVALHPQTREKALVRYLARHLAAGKTPA